MLVRQIGALTTARRAHDEAFLYEERFTDFLDGAGILTHCRGDGVHTHRTTLELVNDGRKNLVVHVIKAVFIHIERFQTDAGDVDVYGAITLDLGKVTDSAQQQIGDTQPYRR